MRSVCGVLIELGGAVRQGKVATPGAIGRPKAGEHAVADIGRTPDEVATTGGDAESHHLRPENEFEDPFAALGAIVNAQRGAARS